MECMGKVKIYLEMIKFEHSVFALPFAYFGAFLAEKRVPEWMTLFWITLAMVGARSFAMAVNRWLDVLDHSAPRPIFGAKMGIDATKKWLEEGYQREWPDEIHMSEEIKKLVDKRWKEYGIG